MDAKQFNFSFGHIGIFTEKKGDGAAVRDLFVSLFGFDVYDAGFGWNIDHNRIEVVDGPGAGTKGHFSILCDDIEGAMQYLESKGVTFDKSTMTYNKEGLLWKVFACEEVAGFAWHLALRGHDNCGY